jgi:hypothetical protein
VTENSLDSWKGDGGEQVDDGREEKGDYRHNPIRKQTGTTKLWETDGGKSSSMSVAGGS